MESYTAKEAKNKLGEVLRAALREPVIITVHGKPSVYVMSLQDAQAHLSPQKNSQTALDTLKHKLSCAVMASFPLQTIKAHAKANIERWRANGVSSLAYDEWSAIIDSPDDSQMINAMVGLSEKSNQLRQSIPYVGMLPKEVVRQLNEEITA